MIKFSSLIYEIKCNERPLNVETISRIENIRCEDQEEIYELQTDAKSYIQMSLRASEKHRFFCRKNIIEYFDQEEKIAEFHVESKDLESIHLYGEESETIIISLYGSMINCRIKRVVNKDSFCLTTLVYPGNHQKVWNSHRDIRYHYIPAKEVNLNNQLIVVFSGMGKKHEYKYNYSKSLQDIHCNKLFIIDDYGDRGSYYLGDRGDVLVETSVTSLILHYASSNNIPLKNIIVMGSSKGGFAALYYGIKYSFGKVVAAAPQTLLGNFLKSFTLEMIQDITGDKETADISYLNQKLFSLIEGNRAYPDIHLMVGSEDNHLHRHLVPLISHLKHKKIEFKYEIIEGYGHDALAVFQNFMTQKAYFLVLGKDSRMFVKSIDILKGSEQDLICVVNCDVAEILEFAYYWYKDNVCINKQFYVKGKSRSDINVNNNQGVFEVLVFVRLNNTIIRLISDKILVE